MNIMIVGLLYSGMVSVLLYYYFCRLEGAGFRWYRGAVYAVLSCGLAVCRYLEWTTEFWDVLLGIMLLAGCGMLFHKSRFIESLVSSLLIISLYSIIVGIMQSVTFWLLSSVNSKMILRFGDLFQNTVVIVLLILTSRMLLKFFPRNMCKFDEPILLVLLLPVVFITFFEAFVSDFIYGNTIIWDTEKGLIFPKLNSFELLVLRLLACGGLISALVAHQKLVTTIQHEQTIQQLEQQTQNQEVYVKEAKLRYEQTRSFRHDIKNHLLILHKLIKEGKTNKAREYLKHMEVMSDSMSFQVQTGNIAVDALLSSKLGVAAQKGIHIHCSILIPAQSFMADIDWCIILSNALDNAINASETIAEQDRWIHLSGMQKGNIYLLNIENRCRENTKTPLEGIGLSNIRAVIKKYNGKMEIEVVDNIFKLNILLIISQHSQNILQQTY
ncbi:sensor histidine kinase [Anaerovorax odorimutans]|uniref:sensor histidine kinase n=1 Tax=Anaerovorax odorimutans TaxID=109327 RepID=UPI0003F4E3F3|nr:GHKL domain-containing protein [Anaerovorax odorimutans]